MNCCIILLLLFFCGQNGLNCRNDNDCDRDCDRDRDRNCGESRRSRESDNDSCPCNESRFEPRFESRPFGGGSTCGCEEN